MTTLELAQLLPPLEPLPPPPPEPDPTPTLWRVVPRLFFSIVIGFLAAVHSGIYLMRADELDNNPQCVDVVGSAAIFAGVALMCALAGARLLSALGQLLRSRRAGQSSGAS
jgi:hypothetical protein